MESGSYKLPTSEAKQTDFRHLMRKVDQVVREIDSSEELAATIHSLAGAILGKLRDALGLVGGRLYHREEDEYVLRATFPDAKPITEEIRVPATYEPVASLLADGVVYMAPDDPRLDPGLERRLGVFQFAAIVVGEEDDFILAFDVAPKTNREDILFSLGVLRYTINQKLREARLHEVFDQARSIQASILPRRMPVYGGFEFWGASRPMDMVGGDFYDLIPITDKILGLAIADVSGHGLPAALQVRDIYMGLRMGLGRDFKIVRTVERLNQIIHKSTLTSRFVSMFYGELELNGVFIYVNAGHPPPFHLAFDGSVRFLEEGGAVLGPVGDATYERGFVRLAPGDLLVFYTDGMFEATKTGADEEHGYDRLIEVARANHTKSARQIVEALFASVDAFTEGAPAQDDRTVLVVRSPAKP